MTAMGNATFNFKALVRGNPIRWLIVGGALLVAGIVVGTAMMVGVFRERALHSAERELDNTVLLLARHFDQQLDDFVSVQREIATRPDLARLPSPDAFRSLMSSVETHEMLQAKGGRHLDIAGINVFDADGNLINSSERWPVPKVNISDRGFFKTFKSGKATSPILIELVNGRFVGGWTTVIAYQVRGWNREFLGVVTRAITPASFEKFFASLSLGDSAAISMYHRDGTLLARYPHVDAMMGQNFENSPAHRQLLTKSDHGTMRLTSAIDGMDRLAAARMLNDFPISIIATTTVSAALADWREQTRFLIAVAALFVLLIAGLLFLVVRKLSQQPRLEKPRLDPAVNNIPQGLIVYDNTAHVTVCNRRYIEMFGLSAEVVKPGCTLQTRTY